MGVLLDTHHLVRWNNRNHYLVSWNNARRAVRAQEGTVPRHWPPRSRTTRRSLAHTLSHSLTLSLSHSLTLSLSLFSHSLSLSLSHYICAGGHGAKALAGALAHNSTLAYLGLEKCAIARVGISLSRSYSRSLGLFVSFVILLYVYTFIYIYTYI